MRKFVIVVSALLFALGLLTTGCGKGNSKSPYHASYGATVNGPDGGTYDSAGGSFMVNLPVYVLQDGKPVNAIALTTWVMPVMTVSSYAVILNPSLDIGDFVGSSDEFDSWSGEGMPIYKTNAHGRANVVIRIPDGFAGRVDLIFDIGVDDASTTITVNAAGGSCFDGKDNNNNGLTDAQDIAFCTGPDATEPSSS